MVRMMKMFAAAVLIAGFFGGTAQAAGESVELQHIDWQHAGPFGTFNRAAAQRGLQVYAEVCSSCHSLNRIRFRELGALGFSEAEVKAIAATFTVTDGPDDVGDMFEREGKPSDPLPAPFANEQAARASNGGALPPDLSLIAKARPGGADYLYSLMVGYEEAPADFELAAGKYYNHYFSGHQIAMPPPLSPDLVEFEDGTPATVQQMAHDVAVFIAWTSEPTMEARKALGFKVIVFLIILAGLFYAVKRKVWSDLH